MAPMRRTLFLALVCLMAVVCLRPSIGTPTRDVLIRNTLSEPVLVYTFDRDQRYVQRVEAGAVWRDTWMYPLTAGDTRLVRVEADDAEDRPLFCAEYGFRDLERMNWQIELVRSLPCTGPPPSPAGP